MRNVTVFLNRNTDIEDKLMKIEKPTIVIEVGAADNIRLTLDEALEVSKKLISTLDTYSKMAQHMPIRD